MRSAIARVSPSWLWSVRRATSLSLFLAAALCLGGLAAPHRRSTILLGALGLGLGIAAADPVLVPVLAVPGTLLVQRVGGSAAGSSIDLSDVILLLGATVSLPLVNWERSRALLPAVGFGALYEAVLLLSVVDNANSHAYLEWGHRLVLIIGALVAGWAVAASGRSRQAVIFLVVGSSVLALVTLEHTVKLHFQLLNGVFTRNITSVP